MKNSIVICGEELSISAKALEYIQRLRNLEKKNRELGDILKRYSIDAAIHYASAKSYSTAVLLFAELYGSTKTLTKKRNTTGVIHSTQI